MSATPRGCHTGDSSELLLRNPGTDPEFLGLRLCFGPHIPCPLAPLRICPLSLLLSACPPSPGFPPFPGLVPWVSGLYAPLTSPPLPCLALGHSLSGAPLSPLLPPGAPGPPLKAPTCPPGRGGWGSAPSAPSGWVITRVIYHLNMFAYLLSETGCTNLQKY